LGIYFLEKGAAQRGSKVIYDRTNSSLATIEPGMVDWTAVFAGAGWFHWTGITPAVAAGAAAVCGEALRAAEAQRLTISCDLNYRHALWKWGKTPREVMPDLVQHCHLLIGNVETVETMLGIGSNPVDSAVAEREEARRVAGRLAERFPRLHTIALTLRDSHSASHNTYSAVLWQRGDFYEGPTYDLSPIVDRVGGGDAFTAGLIYGLQRQPPNPVYALHFGIAAACLKHTIPGDANLVTVTEVEQLMAGDVAGRISR
jgi:2-dehydro-3-deoxygluconokinase